MPIDYTNNTNLQIMPINYTGGQLPASNFEEVTATPMQLTLPIHQHQHQNYLPPSNENNGSTFQQIPSTSSNYIYEYE